jgi:hypothetical protein
MHTNNQSPMGGSSGTPTAVSSSTKTRSKSLLTVAAAELPPPSVISTEVEVAATVSGVTINTDGASPQGSGSGSNNVSNQEGGVVSSMEEDQLDDDQEAEEGEEVEEMQLAGDSAEGTKLDPNMKPGPRRKSCPWCSNRKCNHCRCESYARCDHSDSEPCKRVRYGRRLVCNTCERNKLKDSEKGGHTPKTSAAAAASTVSAPSPVRKATSRKKAVGGGTVNPTIKVPPQAPSLLPGSLYNAGSELPFALSLNPMGSPQPPMGVTISAMAQQTALVAAMNKFGGATTSTSTSSYSKRPKQPLNLSEDATSDFDNFLTMMHGVSTTSTPNSVSAYTMPLSPMMGMQYPFFSPHSSSFVMMNAFNASPGSPGTPITPQTVDPSSFLDLMSTMDYYNTNTTPGGGNRIESSNSIFDGAGWAQPVNVEVKEPCVESPLSDSTGNDLKQFPEMVKTPKEGSTSRTSGRLHKNKNTVL